jgi:adenylate kinase
VTGEPLIQRPDDVAEVVQNRLAVYHEQTEVLIGFYNNMEESAQAKKPISIKIDGTLAVEEVKNRVFAALG